MSDKLPADLVWYNALTLTERIVSLRHAPETSAGRVDTNLAARRLQRWRAQTPFLTDEQFNERLAADGCSLEAFLTILGEPLADVCARLTTAPEWLAQLAGLPDTLAQLAVDLAPAEAAGQNAVVFARLTEPLVNDAAARVRRGLEIYGPDTQLPFDPVAVVPMVLADLARRLGEMLSRCVILELHVARLRDALNGETPTERFTNFIHTLRQPEPFTAFLREYPVLARQLLACVDNAVTFALEFLAHLRADKTALETTFNSGRPLGRLQSLDAGLGDLHGGGRAVLSAEFSTGVRVVYKPRSLAIDVQFQRLLDWLNARGDHPPFRTSKIIDRGDHGWMEFIVAQDCTTRAEVERFYRRQGGYLALLYAIGATDFHHSNLIASGEQPVLVDLETLLHPRVIPLDETQAEAVAADIVTQSVMGVLLLPRRSLANEQHEGVDLSGLGSSKGQLSPHLIPRWEQVGTDTMHLDRQQITMQGSRNRPTLAGEEMSVLAFQDALSAGFVSVYNLLLRHRAELLADAGPLARFAAVEARAVLRPTVAYATLLRESYHPDVLRDALERECLFDSLWAAVERRPQLAKVVGLERNDLLRGDVPKFTVRPGARDLWGSAGERVPDFFSESGLELARRRIERFGAADLAQQLWFIRASLTTLYTGHSEQTQYECTPPPAALAAGQALAEALKIGARLEQLAISGAKDATWLGLAFKREEYWYITPLAFDLYSGLPGVILFLAYLGSITGAARHTELAQRALNSLQQQLHRNSATLKLLGGFHGLGGVIYLLTHLSALWQRPDLLADAQALTEHVASLIELDEYLDVAGGAAGCVASLLSLHRFAPSVATLDVARRCGEHIINSAHTQAAGGIGWTTPVPAARPLTGFSHGAAGMAWALFALYGATGAAHFYAPAQNNWADLRPGQVAQGDYNYAQSWCHGAPGIGLARLDTLKYAAELMPDVRAAVAATVARGFGYNHSLCHGDLGNLDFLLQVSMTLDDPQLAAQVERLTATVLASMDKHGWLCGTPLRVESPGLMTGLAGIGYGLLRLAYPQRVPSVLVLQAPLVE
jgi:type 2 lantibiotic biosynthesis protein LanM